jgi:uncharacterized membrane protein (Fun14 family)
MVKDVHTIADETWTNAVQRNMEGFIQQCNISAQDVVRIASFLAIGFFAGFLLKKYMRHFLLITVILVVLFVALDKFGIILVDWQYVQQLTGIEPQSTIQQVVDHLVLAVRENMMAVISMLVGLAIGYRVG